MVQPILTPQLAFSHSLVRMLSFRIFIGHGLNIIPNRTHPTSVRIDAAEHVTKDPTPTLNLAEKCYTSIHEISKIEQSDTGIVSPAQAGKIQRCLIVFGSICEHSRKFSTVNRYEDKGK